MNSGILLCFWLIAASLVPMTVESTRHAGNKRNVYDGSKPDKSTLDNGPVGVLGDETSLANGTSRAKVDCAHQCKIFLNGSKQDIKDMTARQLLDYIWAIDRMNLSDSTKVAIWDVIKGNRSCKQMTPRFLKRMKSLVLSIPDRDLYHLNMSSLKMVQFLGKIEGFNRRQLGVLAYSMKNTLGENVIQSASILNNINGLLCGFPPQSLEKIAPKIFLFVNRTVFEHVNSCTPRQLKVLLEHAKSHEAYGPPSSWTAEHVNNLGLLLTGLELNDIRQLRPRGVDGLAPNVIEGMTLDQLEVLSPVQIDAMNDDTLSAYRRKTGITNSDIRFVVPTKHLVIVVAIGCILWNYYMPNPDAFSGYKLPPPSGVSEKNVNSFSLRLKITILIIYTFVMIYLRWLYQNYFNSIFHFVPHVFANHEPEEDEEYEDGDEYDEEEEEEEDEEVEEEEEEEDVEDEEEEEDYCYVLIYGFYIFI